MVLKRFLIIATIIHCVITVTGDELLQVHVVFRHGERSPDGTFPRNHVPATAWPQGYGQLTERGMMQHYELGKFLRRRYIEGFPYKFINTSYLRSEIEVRSTDFDRTLMSVYSNLAGLFPPSGWQIWNKNISWQPIPVHTKSLQNDQLLPLFDGCPLYNKMLSEVLESEEVTKKKDELKEFLDYIQKETGLVGSDQLSFVWPVTDILSCQEQFGFGLPAWATKNWDGETVIEKLRRIHVWGYDLAYYKPEMAKYKGGPFVGAVLRNMTDLLLENPTKKFFMYSGHDLTLVSVMATLSVYSHVVPPYASCLMFELIRSSSGVHFIRLLYRNDTSAEPHLISIPGCGNNCSLEQFVSLTKPNIPVDYERECQVEPQNNTDLNKEAVLGACLGISLMLIVILLYFLALSKIKMIGRYSYTKFSKDIYDSL